MNEENKDSIQEVIVSEEIIASDAPRPMDEEKGYIISLPISILAAAILISGSIIYSTTRKGVVAPVGVDVAPAAAVNGQIAPVTERDMALGDKDAPVTFVVYADYQCPFCGRFFTTVEASLIQEYVKTGKVRLVHRDFAFLGPESIAAAEAAECSKDQDKFWQFHDALYTEEVKDGQEHNNNLNRDLFIKLARQVGMNSNEFVKCYDGKKYAKTVEDNVKAAQAAGVDSTPTSFINGQEVQGAQPYLVFKNAIEGLLNQ